MIGKEHSSGVPGKNISIVNGRRLCEYGLLAAKASDLISKIYVSTDCPEITKIGLSHGCDIIERPACLRDPDTLTEDVLSHAHEVISKNEADFDFYVLLYANGGFINTDMLNAAVKQLSANAEFDSCVGAISADMFTPIRAKKITANNELVPFISLSNFNDITSNRDSAGSTYFIDLSLQVIRPKCFETMDGSQPPFLWLGKKIMPFIKDFGGDLDAYWQYAVLEKWITKNTDYG